MPPSFRNRFRRRSPAPSSSRYNSGSTNSSAGGGGGGSSSGISYPGKSFIERRSSQQQQQQHTNKNHVLLPLATFDACIEACDALAASSLSQQNQRQFSSGGSSSSNGRGETGGAIICSYSPTRSDESTEDDGGSAASASDDQCQEEDCLASSTTTAQGQQGENSTQHNDNNNLNNDNGIISPTVQQGDIPNNNLNKQRNNEAIVIPDCSVLVSPDGALLFTSSSGDNNINTSNKTTSSANNNNSNNNNTHDKYPWTKIATEDRDGVILEEEYESAVICGNDLTLHGDYDSNGFSARGWNHDATTVALSSSRDVLSNLEVFVEELATCQKEEAACISSAVSKFSNFRRSPCKTTLDNSKQRHTSMKRLGPIISSGTNLSVAIESMEEYYMNCSESSLERWRMACSEQSHYPTQQQQSMTSAVELKELSNEDSCSNGDETKNGTSSTNNNKDLQQQTVNNQELIQGILPKLRTASLKATTRTSERERALSDIRTKVSEAETILTKQKQWAASQHQRVSEEEANIDRLYAIKKMQQHEYYELQRRKQDSAMLEELSGEMEGPLSDEVWEMVQDVANSMDDFGHTGYSPRQLLRKPTVDDVLKQRFDESGHAVKLSPGRSMPPPPPLTNITRADVEKESELNDIKMVAQAADESVEDAAGKLLNIMSKGDTTLRSASLAAETCLLSECNAAYNTMRSLVAMERTALEERMKRLEVLETAVLAVDVRKDIDNYIKTDKSIQGGRSRAGEDDDGGIAAALAVLNSHGESGNTPDTPRKYCNIERPSYFEGWGEDGGTGSDEDDDNDIVEPEIFGDVIDMLFNPTLEAEESKDRAPGSPRRGKREWSASDCKKEDEKVNVASKALAENSKRGQSFRKSVLYELNNQRSKETQVKGKSNFDALCRIFNAFLSGCGNESVDVSNAKMLMILSQTFFYLDQDEEEEERGSTTKDRQKRIYVKNKICHHGLWDSDDFWDQAAYQCVSESLAKSGVLLNYTKSSMVDGENKAARDPRSIKWHDLALDEYAGAAAQVHSVVFAQLGTLSHSMIELGCGIPRACNFVRRLSIRYQLPLSLRITLIQHLMKKRN